MPEKGEEVEGERLVVEHGVEGTGPHLHCVNSQHMRPVPEGILSICVTVCVCASFKYLHELHVLVNVLYGFVNNFIVMNLILRKDRGQGYLSFNYH